VLKKAFRAAGIGAEQAYRRKIDCIGVGAVLTYRGPVGYEVHMPVMPLVDVSGRRSFSPGLYVPIRTSLSAFGVSPDGTLEKKRRRRRAT